ncbi:MAG: VOC family protein [Acidobacteria bacterium]|nr:VOC family protein [Acidobacteriota bacterium]MBI3489448.1 VOC family protein [Acidobacteriota bacterium]
MADKPLPTGYGTFCWSQLNATDLAACEPFYTRLFGWTALREIMGGHPMSLISRGQDQIATLMEIPPQPGASPRSHWMGYVWVENLDATYAKAQSLGAASCVPPSPVPGTGRFAVVGDPGGAILGLYEQPAVEPARPASTGTGAFCWYELTTRAVEASIAFYTGLFGWTAREWPMDFGTYTLFMRGEEAVAGLMPMGDPEWEGIPNHWMPYVGVADVDERFAAAPGLGGSGCVPPTDIPEVGRFAVVADPTGGVISLLRGMD